MWSRISWAEVKVPAQLDHLLLGSSNLDSGIAFVEQHTGVRAVVGGVHPGRGTRNALLSLDERQYLEIIAPDPEQKDVAADGLLKLVQHLENPELVAWAAHVNDIEALARRLKAAGIPVEGPEPGSRQRPDGKLLRWKTLGVSAGHDEVTPFFIEWSRDTVYPSVDAPGGCRLEEFSAGDPNPAGLTKVFHKLELDVTVRRSEKPELKARIRGPKGTMSL